ncbi:MAG: triacylglycerol lipase [Ruminococcus sp.]|nr:triacylglycerol lipase [Ruminococcus sp.]
MKKIPQLIRCILLLMLYNSVGLWAIVPFGTAAKVLCIIALAIHCIVFTAFPQKQDITAGSTEKLGRLSNGACILGYGRALLWLELIPMTAFLVTGSLSPVRLIADIIAAYLMIFLLNVNGILRIAVSSRQTKPSQWALLFFTWYIPVINSLVLKSFYRTARSEYRFEQAKHELDNLRVESQICRTRYPILMVHGIFFRDWQYFNYWGRVPAELIRNGATVFYGKQQSANLVSVSAGEIAEQIKSIIAETGAEKVNIIAHSKGGLDSRYAISALGMDKYVATLTTINTPHFGCEWVDNVLKKAPQGLKEFCDRKYNRLFSRLGDRDPHFLLGVGELTKAACERFEAEVPDSPNVRYHSVMSRMVTSRAAGFPLNLGYFLNKPYTKLGNDGLVPVESALRGERRSMVPDTRKRGISHGDMIDLFRENIDGFDVREYYVQLVKELKEAGY